MSGSLIEDWMNCVPFELFGCRRNPSDRSCKPLVNAAVAVCRFPRLVVTARAMPSVARLSDGYQIYIS
jgi:hypothetical protein